MENIILPGDDKLSPYQTTFEESTNSENEFVVVDDYEDLEGDFSELHDIVILGDPALYLTQFEDIEGYHLDSIYEQNMTENMNMNSSDGLEVITLWNENDYLTSFINAYDNETKVKKHENLMLTTNVPETTNKTHIPTIPTTVIETEVDGEINNSKIKRITDDDGIRDQIIKQIKSKYNMEDTNIENVSSETTAHSTLSNIMPTTPFIEITTQENMASIEFDYSFEDTTSSTQTITSDDSDLNELFLEDSSIAFPLALTTFEESLVTEATETTTLSTPIDIFTTEPSSPSDDTTTKYVDNSFAGVETMPPIKLLLTARDTSLESDNNLPIRDSSGDEAVLIPLGHGMYFPFRLNRDTGLNIDGILFDKDHA